MTYTIHIVLVHEVMQDFYHKQQYGPFHPQVAKSGLLEVYGCLIQPYGSFYKLGALFMGILSIGALLFGVYDRAPDFWKLPHRDYGGWVCPRSKGGAWMLGGLSK